MNPAINPIQVARLFWRTEAIAVLKKYGRVDGFKSKPADVIVRRLAAEIPIDDLRFEARTALKARENWLGQRLANKRNMTV